MEPESYPTKLKRDLRVSSPQPVYRALADLLEEQGFRVHEAEPPELVAGALAGTATFTGHLLGTHDFESPGAWRPLGMALIASGAVAMGVCAGLVIVNADLDNFLLVLGILAGVVLGGVGLGRLREPGRHLRRVVEVRLEGESYQAGASHSSSGTVEGQGTDLRIERTGIVSDLRVTVLTGLGTALGESGVARWLSDGEQAALAIEAGAQSASTAETALALPADQLDHQLGAVTERFALPEGM